MSRGLLPRRLPVLLVRFGRRCPRVAIAVALIAWVLAALLAARVRVETDILSLVPRDNPVVSGFRTTVERFGSVDTLLVVVELEPGVEMEGSLAFADQLARALRDWELIDWVEYRLENSADAAVPLLDRVTLFLEPEEIDELLDRLGAASLAGEARRIRGQLMAPQSLVTKDVIRLDPMGLLPKILSRVRLGGFGVGVDPDTGCIIDAERRHLLMLARPTRPAQDLGFDKELVAGLDLRLDEARARWKDDGWEGDPPAVEFTGGYVIVLEDSRLITGDVVVGLVSSLVGVMALFLLAFRRPASLFFAFFPLVTGLALAFIFGALALGRVNSLTSAFGGLLIGLGIDFIIVLYGRYVEERQRGASHADAVDTFGEHTGGGVLLGAVTTAGTFYAFLVTDFAGLWELGLLTGTGILLLAATVFVLLPALLTLFNGGKQSRKPLYLHSFGSDLLCRASLRRPGVTLTVIAAVTVVLGLAATRIGWDDDFRNLRSGDNRGIQVRETVMEAFGLKFSPMMIRVDGADEEEALAEARRLLPGLKALVESGDLVGVDTIAGAIPDRATQQAVIDRLAAAAPRLGDLGMNFDSALRSAGLNPAAFKDGLDHLGAALDRREPLRLDDLSGTPLERVVDRYIARHSDGVSVVVYCYPPAGAWRQGASPALQALLAAHPGAVVSGPNIVSAELRRIVWDDAMRAAALGFVLVFALMWADLGSVVKTFLGLAPLVVGMIWMLGGMALLGLKLNFFNVFVLTMVIGIGVDYGVHLLHRWEESAGDPAAVSETAKAIAVAGLTTMVGFGSVVLSHYPGLRSLGAAAILGASSTAVLGMTLLPVLLARWQAAGRNDDTQARG